MKFIIFFLGLSIQISAQTLKYIPDFNLRKELNSQGFLTNDSLDFSKIRGRLQLELNDKGIVNLDGLQYFEQVWRLNINNNHIKQLNNLPPNLTDLECSNNEINQIVKLPSKIVYLKCRNNDISNILNLPQSLTSLDISSNKLTNIPILPNNIQYFNYSNNPIPFDTLPKSYQRIACDDPSQNCLPYEKMNWNILNSNIKDTLFKITGLKIILHSSYSWGFGSKTEEINFNVKQSKLFADKMQINRSKDKIDSVYFTKINYSVDIYKLNNILKDIFLNKMSIEIQNGDSLKIISIKNKKNTESFVSSCDDCTYYNLEYFIYSQSNNIKLNYSFDSGLNSALNYYFSNRIIDIKSILDWLYIYKLTHLTMSNHEIVKNYFNNEIIENCIKWAK